MLLLPFSPGFRNASDRAGSPAAEPSWVRASPHGPLAPVRAPASSRRGSLAARRHSELTDRPGRGVYFSSARKSSWQPLHALPTAPIFERSASSPSPATSARAAAASFRAWSFSPTAG